jgi:hypothetical protein
MPKECTVAWRYNGLFNNVERDIFSFMLWHQYIQVLQLPIADKPGKMKTLFIHV